MLTHSPEDPEGEAGTRTTEASVVVVVVVVVVVEGEEGRSRVVALPKAFTSWKLRKVRELIWTMTYLPEVSWPGIFISNDDFTAAFDLR